MTQEQIVITAVALLDELGLEQLTLRRLADELGVSAPTLYWHVDDKRHLLDLMVEEIYGRTKLTPSPVPGEPWWQWLMSNAHSMRRALISTRDAALVVAGNRPTERSFPYIEQMLHSLMLAGLAPHVALKALRSLNDYVIGSAIEYQAIMARPISSQSEATTASALRESDSFPVLRAALGDPEQSLESIFEAGLRWFIDGLRNDVGAGETSTATVAAQSV